VLIVICMIIIYTMWCVMWCSVCEWLLHRFVMHRSLFKFDYAYVAHTKVHHHIYKYDETYHAQEGDDGKKIPMAWWNGLVIAGLSSLPIGLIFGWYGFCLNYVVSMCYYGVYETIHWYMHLPRQRKVEYWDIFRKLNGHHLLHHRYMTKNFNVVLPFADALFGTLLIRSPIKFKQAEPSYCVPDVQPLSDCYEI